MLIRKIIVIIMMVWFVAIMVAMASSISMSDWDTMRNVAKFSSFVMWGTCYSVCLFFVVRGIQLLRNNED
jgi:hypothetical protein